MYANPYTMCALVRILGRHEMYRFHVSVDFIILPLGNLILIGDMESSLLNTSAPSMRKCSISPESEKYHSKSRFIFGVLILVVAIGRSHLLLACNIDFPDVCRVGLRSGSELPNSAILFISGAHPSADVAPSSFVVIVP